MMETGWLSELEDKVRQAAVELRRLRDENLELVEKIKGLEEQLEAAGQSGPEAEGWQEEKTEIRSRVEALVNDLEQLLEEES